MSLDQPVAFILAGPTASGKTNFSLEIAQQINCEIINGDMGQFYTDLSVGTAKPDWEKSSIPHHLFDIVDHPKNVTVSMYRSLVLETMNQVWKRGNIPLIVGGSLFYLKSLAYPPFDFQSEKPLSDLPSKHEEKNWETLHNIDPDRAAEIHPHDTYRIHRALDIWEATHIKPSLYKPLFSPPCTFHWIFLSPQEKILKERIATRTHEMIVGKGLPLSWIEEIESLLQTEWISFLKCKKLIGYPELIAWVEQGKPTSLLPEVEKIIIQKTWQYARRQFIFWKKLVTQLSNNEKEYSSFSYQIDPSLVSAQEEIIKALKLSQSK